MKLKNSVITFVAVLSILALGLTACAPKNVTANPPSAGPNAGVIAFLDTAVAGCSIAAPLITGPVSALLSGPCVTTMNGILNIVEANGTIAQFQATIDTFKADIAALPPGTPYLADANAAAALFQVALNAYAQASGQTPGATTASILPMRPIRWTSADRAHIDRLKAYLAVKR